jgi:hypothetical protein
MQDLTEASVIAAEIAEYLDGHPNAADSLSGVQAWWLNKRSHLPPRETVRRALSLLVSRRLVRVRRAVGGDLIYSRF